MQKPPTRGRIREPGVLSLARACGPLGSVCVFQRAGSTLLRVTRPRDTVSLAQGRIGCGQLPRNRLTLSELSSERLSKSVHFESDVVAVSRPLCC